VSTGRPTSIRQLLRLLEARLGNATAIVEEPPRPGDVRESVLSPARIRRELGWSPRYALVDGLAALIRTKGGQHSMAQSTTRELPRNSAG
jgi:nucleoside-diphosphate-sugar epimerase